MNEKKKSTTARPSTRKPRAKRPSRETVKPVPKAEPTPQETKQPVTPPEPKDELVWVRVERGTVRYNGVSHSKGARFRMLREAALPLTRSPIGPNGQPTGLPPNLTIIDN